MRKKYISILCSLFFIGALFVGCGKKADKNGSENGIPSWPLLGTSDNNPVARPVVSVKIENSIDARPQTGLTQADIVWEEIAEGGIPRYIAQFNSVLPAKVGPIRSIRPVDSYAIAPEKSVLVASGGQVRFQNMVKKRGTQVYTMDSGKSGFWRVSDRPAPHNVYGDLSKIVKNIDKTHIVNMAIPQFSYSVDFNSASTLQNDTVKNDANANSANKVTVKMGSSSNPVWKYDSVLQKYKKYEGSTLQKVTGGAPVVATNVIVLKVQETNAGGKDPAGNPIPNYKLYGTGTGYIAVGGKYLPIKWSKPNAASIINITDTNDVPVALAPGNTFIEMQPESGSTTIK